jgi:hypothetical protein
MEHLADEFDRWWFIWVLLLEMHYQAKSSIFERGVCRSDNDGIPVASTIRRSLFLQVGVTYQVITLSATGEADTPAGGSVCMR